MDKPPPSNGAEAEPIARKLTKLLHDYIGGAEHITGELFAQQCARFGVDWHDVRVEVAGFDCRDELHRLQKALPATWQTLEALANLRIPKWKRGGLDLKAVAAATGVSEADLRKCHKRNFAEREWFVALGELPLLPPPPPAPKRQRARKPPKDKAAEVPTPAEVAAAVLEKPARTLVTINGTQLEMSLVE